MEQRLSVITLGVDDLESQKRFYTMVLDWEPVAENKDIIFFKMNGFLFSLFDRRALAAGLGVSPEGTGFRSLAISVNVPAIDEVDKLFSALKVKNVKILTGPAHTPFGGYYFAFADPEGNVLEVAYNPYIPLDPIGNVITHNDIGNL